MGKKEIADPYALEAGVPQDNVDAEDAGKVGLRPKLTYADRISKKVIFIAVGFLFLLFGIFMAALQNMDHKKAQKPEEKVESKPELGGKESGGNSAPPELTGVDDKASGMNGRGAGNSAATDKKRETGSLIDPLKMLMAQNGLSTASGVPGTKTATDEKKALKNELGKGAETVPGLGGGQIPKDTGYHGAGAEPLSPEKTAADQAKADRLSRMSQARTMGLKVTGFADEGGLGGADALPMVGPGTAAAQNALLQLAKNGQQGGMMPVSAAAQQNGGNPEQQEKLDFVKNAAKEDRGYHAHVPLPALSKNEVKMGSFIPLTLEQSINSDLPGQITARVNEPVYDSMTGCRLLIPSLAKVVGQYDSKVAVGQGRILVVWNAMIFPDGSELNLAGMQGYDTSGQSGLQSEVDNHYLRLFGLTFGMSMVTAGTQLSVPRQQTGTTGTAQTPAQTIATALAQQYGQLGSQILGKYMNVQPTLRNYAGEKFVIMVPHTIVFSKVWHNRCEQSVNNREF